MLGPVAVEVVPEVVSVEVERILVPFHESHAILSVVVVRLTFGPVKPLDGLVPVRPDPLSGGVLRVSLSSEGSHPELNSVSSLEPVEKLRLEPSSIYVNIMVPGVTGYFLLGNPV